MEKAGLSASDRARMSGAIEAAEAMTAGEFYVVVSRATDDFRLMPVIWAAIAALLLPWPLHLLTSLSSSTILIMQPLFFVALAAILSHPPIRR